MAHRYPIKPIILPRDLRDVKPGELPPNLLRETQPYGWLHHLAADAYHALRAAAFRDDVRPFRPTSAGDTYRTLAMQRAGFLARYQLDPIDGTTTRIWENKKWYLRPGNAPMAAPGSSNHNLGLAVDIFQAFGDRLAWMLANAPAYGWSWELQSEPWHIRYVAGDAVPELVTKWKTDAK